MRKRWLILTALFFLPAYAHAGLMFSEIMYDPAGANSGRQWIEIYNPDSQPVDLMEWTLFQGGVNHKIVTGGASGTPDILPANTYGVMASDVEKFLADWPQYSGALFHSAFTLKASGETISLNNQQIQEDQFSIDPSLGGQGDGNSLQKIGGAWVAGLPSPGIANNGGQSSSSQEPAGGQLSIGPTSSSSSDSASAAVPDVSQPFTQSTIGGIASNNTSDDDSLANFPIAPQIFCSILSDTSFIAGVPGKFGAESWGLERQPLENASYLWNFGDGQSASQQNLFHTYSQPGVYVATLSVGSGKYSALCGENITVASARVSISNVQSGSGGFVELTNQSGQDINLSGFILQEASPMSMIPAALSPGAFYFPTGSFIAADQVVRFSAATLGFSANDAIQLLYPNGVLLAAYSMSAETSLETSSAATTSVSAPASAPQNKSGKTSKKTAVNKVAANIVKNSAKPDSASTLALSSTSSSTSSSTDGFFSDDSSSTDLASILAGTDASDDTSGSSLLRWFIVAVASLSFIILAGAITLLYVKNWKKRPI